MGDTPIYDPQTKIWEAGTKRCVCVFERFFQRLVARIEYSRPFKGLQKHTRNALFRLPKSFGKHAIRSKTHTKRFVQASQIFVGVHTYPSNIFVWGRYESLQNASKMHDALSFEWHNAQSAGAVTLCAKAQPGLDGQAARVACTGWRSGSPQPNSSVLFCLWNAVMRPKTRRMQLAPPFLNNLPGLSKRG